MEKHIWKWYCNNRALKKRFLVCTLKYPTLLKRFLLEGTNMKLKEKNKQTWIDQVHLKEYR